MSRKGFKTVLFGLITGATIGVLFSPDKGDKIRAKINKKARSNKHVSSALDKLTDTLKDVFKKVKKELHLEESKK